MFVFKCMADFVAQRLFVEVLPDLAAAQAFDTCFNNGIIGIKVDQSRVILQVKFLILIKESPGSCKISFFDGRLNFCLAFRGADSGEAGKEKKRFKNGLYYLAFFL